MDVVTELSDPRAVRRQSPDGPESRAFGRSFVSSSATRIVSAWKRSLVIQPGRCRLRWIPFVRQPSMVTLHVTAALPDLPLDPDALRAIFLACHSELAT